MKSAQQEFSGALLFEKKEDLIAALKNNPNTNSTILVKASRGIGLETIVDFL